MKCSYLIVLAVSVLLGSQLFDITITGDNHLLNSFQDMLVYVFPVEWFANGMFHSFWLASYYLLPSLYYFGVLDKEDCFINDNDLRIILTVPKGGTVLSLFLCTELMKTCGIRGGITYTDIYKWPGSVLSPPSFELDLLLVIGITPRWESYFEEDFNQGKNIKCAVLTRNPYERLVSMYKYARDAGEKGLKELSARLEVIDSLEERFELFWRSTASIMMEDTHSILVEALVNRNCTPIRFDTIIEDSEGFQSELSKLLDVLDVKNSAKPKLLKILSAHDLSVGDRKSKNFHSSGKKVPMEEVRAVRDIMEGNEEVVSFLDRQCADLGYSC